ncbi:MAG: hypothetical protein ISN28_15420 [Ectothiorhodospiraceae bacterium AqS1]|nr:hypothetical protein [Ectothiorhodospiraceae bacterium AqS1]MBF2761622.1 hypothetical protein [Ectothiorhodospiraceae bacterium AqS1]
MEFNLKVSIDMERFEEAIKKEIQKRIEEALQNEVASRLQGVDVGHPAKNKKVRKGSPPVPFEDFGLIQGAILHAIADPRVTVKVTNMKKRKVTFDGEEMGLSVATERALGLKGKRGAHHWMYKGEPLVKRLAKEKGEG